MNEKRLILVLVDGLGWHASSAMGFMRALSEEGFLGQYRVRSELPSLSRPLYETVLTGLSPVKHGVLSNGHREMSASENIFSLCRAAGMRTAAAAYSWVSELYNRVPFDPLRDILTADETLPIQRGCFYYEDSYPDEHLFFQGERMRQDWDPHFLLIHPMNVDEAGHRFGGNSKAYRESVRRVDDILSRFIPLWLEEGYSLIVTGDHGMAEDGNHRGDSPEEREVPLWVAGEGFAGGHRDEEPISQLQVAPLICRALGIATGEGMTSLRQGLLAGNCDVVTFPGDGGILA